VRQRLRAFFSRGGDLTFALVLVVAFFLVFMVILILSFPKGVGIDTRREPEAQRSAPPPPQAGTRPESWESTVARLTWVQRNVKAKPADSIVWTPASAGLSLGEQDAVQTFADSGASIAFDRNQTISLGENALIVIRRFEREPALGAQRASVVLLRGAVEGSVAGSSRGASTVEVVAGHAATSISSAGGGTTRFRVAAGTDEASVVAVTRGRAEVKVGNRSIAVGSGQSLTIRSNGSVSGPSSLAPPPVLETPADGATVFSGALPANIGFVWKPVGEDASYRIEIARNASFKEPLLDRPVAEASFGVPDLPAGSYAWRVRSIRKGAEGRPSEIRTFDVATDRDPPALHVQFPVGRQRAGVLSLHGETDPGARVFVGKSSCAVAADGTFEAQVALSRGVQIVVVQAMDVLGNVAYASRMIAAR